MTEAIFKPIQIKFVALMVLLPYALSAYPVFGMKRYGRSTAHPQNGWGVSSVMHIPSHYYQPVPRPQTYYPYSYYDAMNLYAPDYDEYYYPQVQPQLQDSIYPFYYPAAFSRANSNNYDFYHQFIPFYYAPNSYGYYENSDPMEDLQEEVLQEEREQREEAYPIGQETWYEPETPETQESLDDVNAAFMKNLMLYNKAMSQPNYVYGKVQPDAYNQDYTIDNSWNPDPYNYEDKNEQDLHMLTEAPKKQKPKSNKKQSAAQERMQMFNSNNNNRNQKNRYQPNDSESWLNFANKRNTQQQQQQQQKMILTSSTAAPEETTAGMDSRGGQKEVVMMRPATPVRRPFSEPVMKLLAEQGGPERKRTPSVYDTIKRMLEMEKSLEKEYRTNNYYRPAMRKRFVSNEESLVEELAGLKKTA